MRATLISPNPGSNAGGVERFCALLEKVMEDAGWAAKVLGPAGPAPPRLARLGLGPTLQAVSATRKARAEHADLVISNGFLGGPTGGRRVHVYHGTMVEHVRKGATGSRRYRLRELAGGAMAEALCARGATSVVAVSRSTAGEVERLYRQRVDAVIPNAVDTDLFSPGDRVAARTRLGLGARRRQALRPVRGTVRAPQGRRSGARGLPPCGVRAAGGRTGRAALSGQAGDVDAR